jgi:hypothetical protein
MEMVLLGRDESGPADGGTVGAGQGVAAVVVPAEEKR